MCFLFDIFCTNCTHGIHHHPDHHLVDVFWDVFSKHQTCKSEDMKPMLLASRLYCVDHFNTVIWILQHGSLVMPKIEVDLYPVNPWNCSSCKQHDVAVGNWRNPSWKRPNVQVSWFQSVLWTASTGLVDTLLLKSWHQFLTAYMSKWLLYCCPYILILQFQQSSSLLCEMSCFTLLYLAGRWHHFTVELPEKKEQGWPLIAGRLATASCACIKLLLSRWLNATSLYLLVEGHQQLTTFDFGSPFHVRRIARLKSSLLRICCKMTVMTGTVPLRHWMISTTSLRVVAQSSWRCL